MRINPLISGKISATCRTKYTSHTLNYMHPLLHCLCSKETKHTFIYVAGSMNWPLDRIMWYIKTRVPGSTILLFFIFLFLHACVLCVYVHLCMCVCVVCVCVCVCVCVRTQVTCKKLASTYIVWCIGTWMHGNEYIALLTWWPLHTCTRKNEWKHTMLYSRLVTCMIVWQQQLETPVAGTYIVAKKHAAYTHKDS